MPHNPMLVQDGLAFELTTGTIEKGTKESAAFDLFYNGDRPLWIGDFPVAIPTGVKTKMTEGLVAILEEKSGLGLKGIEIKAGIIDADYREEWLVIARNPVQLMSWKVDELGLPILDPTTEEPIISLTPRPDWKPFLVKPGDKICQFIVWHLPPIHFYSMDAATIRYKNVVRRGGFGSTDTHAPIPEALVTEAPKSGILKKGS